MMMHYVRSVAEQVLPRVMPYKVSSTLLAVGDRYAQYRRYKHSPVPAATRLIESRLGLIVQAGPFQGMRYPAPNAYSRHAIPRLMGCYEEELHPALFRCLADRSIRRFVDIGSADGYYSVGFAFAGQRKVHAFEIDPFERRYTRLMARLNRVEHLVELDGWCGPEELKRICRDRSFILCDCEGYEAELFPRPVAEALHHSDLIIELHEVAPGHPNSHFLEHFSETHHLEYITARPRLAANCPAMTRLGLLDDGLVSEFRQPEQRWAVLTAKSS